MQIRLRPYSLDDRVIVQTFEVTAEQAAFVVPISEALHSEQERDSFIIEADSLPVGFFQIDHSSGSQCVDDHLELHEVSIDRQQQGKGYGKYLMQSLPDFLRTIYPNWRGVCLSVNCRNDSAKRLYELGGFEDAGHLKLGGRSGPQFVMRRDL